MFGLFFTPNPLSGIPFFLFGLGVGALVQAVYKFPGKEFPPTTIAEAMSNLYASPVRGTPIAIEGKMMGRGVAGFILSEDVMLQDKTGFLYVNFESLIPLIGNLWFSLTKVKQLLGKPAHAQGWFVRGLGQSLVLHELKSDAIVVKSRQKLLAVIAGLFWLGLGALVYIFLA